MQDTVGKHQRRWEGPGETPGGTPGSCQLARRPRCLLPRWGHHPIPQYRQIRQHSVIPITEGGGGRGRVGTIRQRCFPHSLCTDLRAHVGGATTVSRPLTPIAMSEAMAEGGEEDRGEGLQWMNMT